MRTLHLVITFFIIFTSYAQLVNPLNENTRKVQNFIIYNQYNQSDSASFYLNKLHNYPYEELRSLILNKKKVAYREYDESFSKVLENLNIEYEVISNHINKTIKKPVGSKKINLEYVFLKWIRVSKLKDEVSLEVAFNEYKKLEIYVAKFNEKDVADLILKFIELGNLLNLNQSFKLLNMSLKALKAHGFYEEAIIHKEKAINIITKVYSEDLSKFIAKKNEIEQAIKVKEIEISVQKDKTKLYIIIASLFLILLLVTLMVLIKIRKQSKELSFKNQLINDALAEKELLIKEVHHRVKNNFQIIASLLELQCENVEDEQAIERINQSKNRIKSMALIHQRLYKDEEGLIDFNDYIGLLIKEISIVHQLDVKIIIKVENIFFDVDTAIPLGLIINEIITNAYKHAFKSDKKNMLSVSISKQNQQNYKLIIQDNGSGVFSSFRLEKTKSTGLTLVKRLVKQLQGNLELLNNHGTRFELIFKNSKKRNI